MSDKPVKISVKDSNVNVEQVNLDDIEDQSDNPLVSTEQRKSLLPQAKPRLKEVQTQKPLRRFFWPSLAVFISGAAIYESYLFIKELFSSSTLLGVSALVIAGTVVASGIYGLVKGWLGRRKLAKRTHKQKTFQQLINENTYGESKAPLEEVSQEIEQYVDLSGPLTVFKEQRQQVHNDREVIQIYSQTVLEGLDEMALEVISKHATESAVLVALSPLAAADMALVAWRSSKMLQEVSRVYGCPQSALGRISLTKSVMTNMMLAGASDMLADAGAELLGKSLTATVSTKVAQGIGVGLLIARMGIQTMKLCRPIEFTDDNKPKLSYIRKALYQRITTILKKSEPSKDAVKVKGEQYDRD